MKICITGASGSLGSFFPDQVQSLETRLESPIEDMVSELQKERIKPDVFIHSSALVPVPFCNNNPKLAYELNVNGTERWFRAAHRISIPKFVFISTSHVFEPTLRPIQLASNHAPNPISVYGKSKLDAELCLRQL